MTKPAKRVGVLVGEKPTTPKPGATIVAPKSALVLEFEAFKAKLELELDDLDEVVSTYTVDDQSDLELAAETVATVKGHMKKLDKLKKSMLEPIKAQDVETRALFTGVVSRLEKIETGMKVKVGKYHLEAERKQAQALNEAAVANRSGFAVKTTAALARAEESKPEPVKGMSIRYTIDVEIVDESLIPDEYWEVDVDRIAKVARATNGEVTIPGVAYHKRPIVSSTAKT